MGIYQIGLLWYPIEEIHKDKKIYKLGTFLKLVSKGFSGRIFEMITSKH